MKFSEKNKIFHTKRKCRTGLILSINEWKIYIFSTYMWPWLCQCSFKQCHVKKNKHWFIVCLQTCKWKPLHKIIWHRLYFKSEGCYPSMLVLCDFYKTNFEAFVSKKAQPSYLSSTYVGWWWFCVSNSDFHFDSFKW